MLKSFVLVIIVVVIPGNFGQSGTLKCRNNAGNPVDWFIIYKIPQNAKPESGTTLDPSAGNLFAHMTSENPHSGWIYSSVNKVDSDTAMLHRTLKQTEKLNAKFLVYNDQETETPDTRADDVNITTTSKAHAKGFIWYKEDTKTGIYMAHTVPYFEPIPNITSSLTYPSNGLKNGQLLFCISFAGQDNRDQILQHLKYMDVNVQDSKNTLKTEYDKYQVGSPGSYSTKPMRTSGGLYIGLLAKAPKPSSPYEDQYEVFAQSMKSSMRVLSWTPDVDTIANIKSTKKTKRCHNSASGKKLTAEDIQQILMIMKDGNTFKALRWGACTSKVSGGLTVQDHSKWVINGADDFCLGDMNRNFAQTKRSGGLICIKHPGIKFAFNTIISI